MNETAIPFASLAALRSAHNALLTAYRSQGDTGETLARIAAFIDEGRRTGALLDQESDRAPAQSLLDYWVAVLYRAGKLPPDSGLADFDPGLAPDLHDRPCPYVGLDAFSESRKDVFFGRQRLADALIERLGHVRLLAVVGPSGSGKSSLVLAGLVPMLKTGALPGSATWRYLPRIVPGSHPLDNLARLLAREAGAALAGADPAAWARQQVARLQENPRHLAELADATGATPVVAVVDQFEEVFTLCASDDERQAFVGGLVALAQSGGARHSVILTMRSDFRYLLPRLSEEFQRLVEDGAVEVTALSAAELREAIEKPAALIGLKYEAGLVDALIRDILGEPAALPLLQFTLRKLWETRDRNRITWEAYRRLGSGRVALANSADTFYTGLIPQNQEIVRRIFLRLVRPGQGPEFTSNRMRRSQLYPAGQPHEGTDELIDRLIAAQLLRLSEGDISADVQVEVAHEALVRNWPRLANWLEEERETLRRRQRLTDDAEQWERLNRDRGALLQPALLHAAQSSIDVSGIAANPLEAEFLAASAEASEAAEREREAARQRELQQARALSETERRAAARLRMVALALAVACLVAIAASIFAEFRRQDAVSAQHAASTAEVDARTKLLVAQTAVALYGAAGSDAQQAWRVAQQALDQNAAQLERLVARDPAALATAAALQTAAARASRTAVPKTPIRPPFTRPSSIAGPTAAGAAPPSSTPTATTSATEPATPPPLQPAAATRLALPLQYLQLKATQTVVAARLQSSPVGWQLAATLAGHSDGVNPAAFSPDGRLVVTGSYDDTARVWDVATGQAVRVLEGHTGPIWSVAFSPDGSRIATGSRDHTVRVWDVKTGDSTVLAGHTSDVWQVAFSPDGRWLAAAAGAPDNTILMWDFASQGFPAPAVYLQGHTKTVWSARFSPDGRSLVSASSDNTARIWDWTAGRTRAVLAGHTDWVTSARFSPDGKYVVTTSADHTARAWDAATGALVATLQHPDTVWDAAFSPDGKLFATACADGNVRVWDMRGGDAVALLTGHTGAVTRVVFSRDSDQLLTASVDRTARVFDLAGAVSFPLLGHTDRLYDAAFSPDGRLIVTTSADKTARLWRAGTSSPKQ